MLKIILLGLLCSPLIANSIENQYPLVYEEEQNEGIVDNKGDYYIINRSGNYYLENDSKKVDLGRVSQVKMFFYQDKVMVLELAQKELSLKVYSKLLVLEKDEVLIRDGAVYFDFKINGSKLLIYGESDETNDLTSENNKLNGRDAFIIDFDLEKSKANHHYYGGKTNESFIDLAYGDGCYYLVGRKSGFGEGDFGNGGSTNSLLITKIDQNYQIVNYKIIDTVALTKGIYFNQDRLFVILNDSYLVFSSDLKLNERVDLGFTVLVSKSSSSGLICLIGPKNYLVIDFSRGTSEIIDHPLDLESSRILSDYILGFGKGYYRIDVVNLGGSTILQSYNKEERVETLFSEANLISEEFTPLLDYQVYGNYDVLLKYETIGGINFEINSNLSIPYEVNLENGGIYPSGYRVIFTGKGYLDGNMILPNYQLNDSGPHTLVLKGIDSEATINFEVSQKQIEFSDPYTLDATTYVNLNENLTLKISLDIGEEYDVSGVVIDGTFYSASYDKAKKILFIPYKNMNEVGQFKITLEKILYHNKDREFSLSTKEEYIINVKKPRLEVKVQNFSDNKITIDCIDSFQCARYFLVTVKNEKNGVEESYKYPLSTSDIYLDGFNESSDYVVSYYLVSDYGGKNLESTLLSSMRVNGSGQLYLGQIKVLSYEGTLNRFSIELSDDFVNQELKDITILDQVIYTNERDSLLKYILLLVVVFMGGLFIPVTIKMIIGKKRHN